MKVNPQNPPNRFPLQIEVQNRNRTGSGDPLTSAQCQFASFLGQLLAELWDRERRKANAAMHKETE